MLVAPVALRIRCLQKSIEIVNVLKTNRKATILTISLKEFCVIVFDSSSVGLALSLREVEISSGRRCPEVALNEFALTS